VRHRARQRLGDADLARIPPLAGTSHVAVIRPPAAPGGGHAVRFFTSAGELPSCGHGTVAAIAVLSAGQGRAGFQGRLRAGGRDFDATGAACVDHLAELGHRDIALIGEGEGVYQRHTGFAARTLAGFQRQAAERGLRAVHRTCEGTYESTAGVLARILEERPTTTGFVVQNEAAIAPLLSLLRLSGRVVPEDTSVVAICPDQVALQSSPRLTSVSIPAEDMGRQAVRQAMAQMAGGHLPSVTLLPPRLTVRDSSAAAPVPASVPVS